MAHALTWSVLSEAQLDALDRHLAALGRIAMRGAATSWSEEGEAKSLTTKEVLDQFERNPDQQQFMLTVLEKLDERSISEPDAFNELALTTLS